jgi:hypothetical protein
MGVVITISVYYMSVNGRYTVTQINDGTVLILDTRTGQATVKMLTGAGARVPNLKLVTVVPWAEERGSPDDP